MYFIMQYMRIKRHHHVDYSTIDFCAVAFYRFIKQTRSEVLKNSGKGLKVGFSSEHPNAIYHLRGYFITLAKHSLMQLNLYISNICFEAIKRASSRLFFNSEIMSTGLLSLSLLSPLSGVLPRIDLGSFHSGCQPICIFPPSKDLK